MGLQPASAGVPLSTEEWLVLLPYVPFPGQGMKDQADAQCPIGVSWSLVARFSRMKSSSVLPGATVPRKSTTRWYRCPSPSVTVPISLKPVASAPWPLTSKSLSVDTSPGCTGEVGHLEVAREARNLPSHDVYVHSSLQHFAGPIGSGDDELLIRVPPRHEDRAELDQVFERTAKRLLCGPLRNR